MSLYQIDVIIKYDWLSILHIHDKFGIQWTNGFGDNKQRDIWTWPWYANPRWYRIKFLLFYDVIRLSYCMHIPNLKEFGSSVAEIQYKDELELWPSFA